MKKFFRAPLWLNNPKAGVFFGMTLVFAMGVLVVPTVLYFAVLHTFEGEATRVFWRALEVSTKTSLGLGVAIFLYQMPMPSLFSANIWHKAFTRAPRFVVGIVVAFLYLPQLMMLFFLTMSVADPYDFQLPFAVAVSAEISSLICPLPFLVCAIRLKGRKTCAWIVVSVIMSVLATGAYFLPNPQLQTLALKTLVVAGIAAGIEAVRVFPDGNRVEHWAYLPVAVLFCAALACKAVNPVLERKAARLEMELIRPLSQPSLSC